jgi:hypothetical protein
MSTSGSFAPFPGGDPISNGLPHPTGVTIHVLKKTEDVPVQFDSRGLPVLPSDAKQSNIGTSAALPVTSAALPGTTLAAVPGEVNVNAVAYRVGVRNGCVTALCDELGPVVIMCRNAEHRACGVCLNSWVNAQMDIKRLPIQCAADKCKETMLPSVLQSSLLNESTKKRLGDLERLIEERRKHDGPTRAHMKEIEPQILNGQMNLCPSCKSPVHLELQYGVCRWTHCPACGRRFRFGAQCNCLCFDHVTGCYCSGFTLFSIFCCMIPCSCWSLD